MELLVDDHLKFGDENKLLLTSQVLLTDRIDKLAASIEDVRDAQKHTDEQIATDERLEVLIRMMDDLILRNRPARGGTAE